MAERKELTKKFTLPDVGNFVTGLSTGFLYYKFTAPIENENRVS